MFVSLDSESDVRRARRGSPRAWWRLRSVQRCCRCARSVMPRTRRSRETGVGLSQEPELSDMWHTLLAVLLALQVSTAPASEYPAKVVGVSDGDTLTVLRADKTAVK